MTTNWRDAGRHSPCRKNMDNPVGKSGDIQWIRWGCSEDNFRAPMTSRLPDRSPGDNPEVFRHFSSSCPQEL